MKFILDGSGANIQFHYFEKTKGRRTTACVIEVPSEKFMTYGEVTRWYKDVDCKINGRREALREATKFFNADQRIDVNVGLSVHGFKFF